MTELGKNRAPPTYYAPNIKFLVNSRGAAEKKMARMSKTAA